MIDGIAGRTMGGLGLLIVAAMAAGCSPYAIRVDIDRVASQPALVTYAWLPDHPSVPKDPRISAAHLDRVVREAADKELAAKGYTRQSGGDADFYITYHATLRQEVESGLLDDHYAHFRQRDYIGASSEPRAAPKTYEAGTLILDMSAGENREVFWRGCASAKLHLERPQAERDERVRGAVAAILKRFRSRRRPGHYGRQRPGHYRHRRPGRYGRRISR